MYKQKKNIQKQVFTRYIVPNYVRVQRNIQSMFTHTHLHTHTRTHTRTHIHTYTHT